MKLNTQKHSDTIQLCIRTALRASLPAGATIFGGGQAGGGSGGDGGVGSGDGDSGFLGGGGGEVRGRARGGVGRFRVDGSIDG